jgi:hypothetical protein
LSKGFVTRQGNTKGFNSSKGHCRIRRNPHWCLIVLGKKFGLLVLCLTSVVITQASMQHVDAVSSGKTPAPIYQAPLGPSQASPGDPYWYQTGAMGSSSSSNYVAASVMIKTVYDTVNGDAHSYWVGGFIANNAFVQVGYLNEISTNNQSYCCAWFYEYFYPSPSTCCGPIIGLENSAGPIGSWHNYTLSSNNDGTWSFYFDGQPLGRTPDLGGTAAANSGSNSPAAMTEVAAASSNTDIIGPGEFMNLSFRTGTAWQPVAAADSFIWYGKGSFSSGSPPPNPYGVREVEGVDNDFLAGSYVPPLAGPSQTPGPSLWPWSPLTIFRCCISFDFLDDRGFSFEPSWASLQSDSGTPIFFTGYGNQLIRDGTWTLTRAVWHSVDVALPAVPFTSPGTSGQAFQTSVFSVQLHIVGYLTGLPIGGASVTTTFPDTLSQTVRSDTSGNAIITQLPPSVYVLRMTIPYGVPASVVSNVTASVQLTARVIGLSEVALIVGVPISAAVLIMLVAVNRERKRGAAMHTIPTAATPSGYCVSCGQPLYPSQMYCTNCGTRVPPAPV